MNADYVLHGKHSRASDRAPARKRGQMYRSLVTVHCTLTINQAALVWPAVDCLGDLQRKPRVIDNALAVSGISRAGGTITFTLERYYGDKPATKARNHGNDASQLSSPPSDMLTILRSILEERWRVQCNRRVIRSSTTWTTTG